MIKINKIGGLKMKKHVSYSDLTFDERTEWLEDNLGKGMYVRTDNGIDRFNYKLKRENQDFYWYCFEKKELTNPGSYVEKEPSYDIINLIEVGDYVNGLEVMSISYFKDGRRYIEFDDGKYLCKNYQIESIVTKAQFESIKYEVKNDQINFKYF